jgi:hypothetical protein
MNATMDGKIKVEVQIRNGRYFYFNARTMRWFPVAAKRLEF